MLTLLTYPKLGPEFSLSPFCVKAAMMLSFARAPWQREDITDPRKMPYSKLPVLRTDDRLIADSGAIRSWLENRGTEFDQGLSAKEKGHAHALVRMAEENLYFHIVRDRWDNDPVWPTIRDAYFGTVPGLLRRPITNSIRKSVQQGLSFQGTGRFTDADRTARLETDLIEIATLLNEQPFLMGEKLSSADFSVAPMLQAMRATPAKTELVKRISQDAQLSGYIDRVFETVPLT